MHPVVWAAVGGGAVAVGALIVGLLVSANGSGTAQRGADVLTDTVTSPVAVGAVGHSPIEGPGRVTDSVWREQTVTTGSPQADLLPDEVFRRCSPSVVSITVKNENGRPIFTGSGFVIIGRRTGSDVGRDYLEVVTNYHVIEAAVDADVEFENGQQEPVSLVLAENKLRDVAILGVKPPATPPHGLDLTTDVPAIGKEVFAIGSPENMRNTLSEGIAQGPRRLGDAQVEYLQFSAAISHGSSGGPLLNARGEVVGVTTLSRKSGQNLNFAAPASAVEETLKVMKPREVWRGASMDRECKEAFQKLAKSLETRGRPLSDAAVRFASVAGPQDDKGERLKRAIAARDSVPDEFQFLVDLEIGETYSVIAFLKSIEGDVSMSPEQRRSLEEYRLAVSWLNSSASRNSSLARTWANLCSVHIECGQFEKALDAANRAVALAPRCAYAHSSRGRCYKELGRLSEAVKDFEEATSLQPDDPDAYGELGSMLHKTGDLAEAAECLNEAAELTDSDKSGRSSYTAWVELGKVYFEMRNYRKALYAFEIASDRFSALSGMADPYLQVQIAKCKKMLEEQ